MLPFVSEKFTKCSRIKEVIFVFTKEDLTQMKDECVQELEKLGYEVLPIDDIDFSRKLKLGYAAIHASKRCYRNRKNGDYENAAAVIRIQSAMSELPELWRNEIKIIIMHECIHAIKNTLYPKRLFTDHGAEYDTIVDIVEKRYGYVGIDSNDYNGFESVLPQIIERQIGKKQRVMIRFTILRFRLIII